MNRILIFTILTFSLACAKSAIPDLSPITLLGQLIRSIVSPVPKISLKNTRNGIESGANIRMGSKVVNTTASPEEFTVQNAGQGILSLTGEDKKIQISGDNADEFIIDQETTRSSLYTNGSTTFTITYSPKTAGLKKATIQIPNSAGTNGNFVFTIEARASLVPEPYIVVSSSKTELNSGVQVDYPQVQAGSKGEEQKFKIYNLGTSQLTINTILIDPDSSQFIIQQPFPSTVDPDKTVDFSVTFNPTSQGDKTSSISVQSNDPYLPNVLAKLSATATKGPEPKLSINPQGGSSLASGATYNIGSSYPGNTPLVKVFEIKNSGDKNLNITAQNSLSGTNASEFLTSQPISSIITPGSSTTFNLTFNPTTGGSKSAVLTVNSDDSTSPAYILNIAGNASSGPQPQLNIKISGANFANNSTYGFGNQGLGTTSSAIPIVVENLGAANLVFSTTVNLTGTNAGEFSALQPVPTTVAAGATSTFYLQFTPTVTGARTAQAIVATNDPTTPSFTINLTGTGTSSSDTTKPIITNSTWTISSITTSSATFNLSSINAVDDVTSSNSLTFQIYYSSNIADVNGTGAAIVSGSATAWSSPTALSQKATPVTITGLTPTQAYYFNVVIRDQAQNASELANIYIPYVTTVTSSSPNNTYGFGSTISIRLTYSTAVTVTGTPTLSLNTGATVNYSSGSGSSNLIFSYTVGAGENTADLDYASTTALSLAGGTISTTLSPAFTNLASPGAANSLGANKDLVVDTSSPTVTNVTATNTNGVFGVSGSITIQVTFSALVDVVGTPTIALSTGANASYASGSGSNTLNFLYTVAAGQTAADLDYVSTAALTAGTSIKGAISNVNATLTLPAPGATNSLGANKDLVVDTTAPTVGNSGTITYSSATSSSIQINWTAGTDNYSSVANLKYSVYSSSSNNLTNLANTLANGTLVTGPTLNITSFNHTGLSPTLDYYYNVIIEDEVGNKASYAQGITSFPLQRITVKQGTTTIAHNGTYNFGPVGLNGTDNDGYTVTFTIENTGTGANLTLSSVSLSATDFSVIASPTIGSGIAPAGTTTFQLRFLPNSAISYTGGTFTINSDDLTTPSYVLNLTGSGIGSLATGIIFDYQFSGTINDSSGNSNHATLGAGTEAYATDRKGNTSQALLLDGATYLTSPSAAKPVCGASFSISAYVKLNSISAPASAIRNSIFFLGDSITSGCALGLEIYDAGIPRFFGTNGLSQGIMDNFSPTALVANTWFHIVVVYTTGVDVKIYVNGNLDYTGGTTYSCGTNPWYAASQIILGAGWFNLYFNGALDDIRYYNKILTPTEIQALKNL